MWARSIMFKIFGMKTFVISLFFGLNIGLLVAQSPYDAALIPDDLFRDADVVVRLHTLTFEVQNPGEAIETEHKVITLLNTNAATEQVFWYGKFQSIKEIEGVVYDSNGKKVRKLSKSDIKDRKSFEQFFVDDYRYKLLEFPRLSFPYTIEYKVVKQHKGLLHYPVFNPQASSNSAIESATFEVIAPDSLQVRFKETNVLPTHKTGPMRWGFQHIKAFKPEPFLPLSYSNSPTVLSAPTSFRIEGYEGDLSSWASFGKFIQKLNAEKVELPNATKFALLKLTTGCPDATCKAQRLYDYLQNTTRYYFVGLGIGGWQPMPASEVDKFKYSDCKGLSNYMVAMLEAVGVPAYYALIRASAEQQKDLTLDFPNAWFNHATLCIPMPKDTIWLECTSQNQSFGYLSDFTDDRLALVVFPEGGKILQTPRYDETVNTIHRTLSITLAADGSASVRASNIYRGLAQDTLTYLAGLHTLERRKKLYASIPLNDFEITDDSISFSKDRIPSVAQNLSLQVQRFASLSGKRLFVPTQIYAAGLRIPVLNSARKFPVQAHSRGFTEENTLTFLLPDGFSVENAPIPISLDSAFGHFEMFVQQSPGQVQVYHKFLLNNSIQPKEKYLELETFLKQVSKAFQTKLVLVNEAK